VFAQSAYDEAQGRDERNRAASGALFVGGACPQRPLRAAPVRMRRRF
jgi:hypothetical protein